MKNGRHAKIIANYLSAYNTFDIDAMLADMSDDVRFECVFKGNITFLTKGIAELRDHAVRVKHYFRQREQRPTGIKVDHDRVEIESVFTGVLAADAQHGQQAGDTIEMKVRSEFLFKDDKIVGLKYIS